MKKCIKILNARYLDFDGKEVTIGGVQTYITNLAKVARELDMRVEVFQFANNDFTVKYQDMLIHGVGMNLKAELLKKKVILYNYCMKTYDEQEDIFIYGSDNLVVKTKAPFAIAIQHGIGWDIQNEKKCSRIQNIIYSFRQAWRGTFITEYAASVKELICVDYNYINWYRTQIQHREMEYRVIPNFTEIPNANFDKFNDESIRIIFARRLVPYRGTRIFAKAAERLLAKYNDIEITFAGDGPEENFLKEIFQHDNRVKFITYLSYESLDIHEDKHIAVVPTIGSEGTSLSLLEAMASSCAVVCSNVGGMTNIVIDNFNGLIVNPEEDSLFNALDRLVADKCLAKSIAIEAYKTARKGFSFELWKEKWKEVLRNFK